jgi:hypothetical protein
VTVAPISVKMCSVSTPGSGEFKGGWFVVDGEVEHLDDVIWAPTVADGSTTLHARIIGGDPTEHVGTTLPLASAADLDEARRDTVRRFWLWPIGFVVCVALAVTLEVAGMPWRTSVGRELLVGATVIVPGAALFWGAWWFLTRDVHGRVVRAMSARRIRSQYERQRAVVAGDPGPDQIA